MAEPLTPGFLGRRVLLFGTLPGLLLIGCFIYLALGGGRLEQSRRLVTHSFDAMFAASSVEVAMQDAERGQRGYLLTGEDKYLKSYTRGAAAAPKGLERLHDLTLDDPAQQGRITALQQSVTVKLDELKRTVDVRRDQGMDAAMAIVRTDVGENAMNAIGASVGQIVNVEQATLRERLQSAADEERNLTLVASAGGLLSVILIALITLELYRSARRSVISETALRATLDSVREGVSAFDSEHRLVAWNRVFIDLLRLPADFIRRGLTLEALQMFESSRGDHGVATDLSTLDTNARRGQKPLLVERERGDGTAIELYQNPSPGGGFVTTYIDVTARKHAEMVARQAQKMESLGQMTGEIAHDFNNLLTIIIGNLDRLRSRFKDDPATLRYVDLALMGADRGAKLTHQLLAFARRQPLEPRPVHLGQLLPDLTDMLRRSLGEQIEIETIGTGGLWNTSIDPNQFESAVLNLAINARDAMPNGGKLTLEVANVWLDESYAASHEEVAAGQYVMFGVTDTGTGMPADVAARAFDPFFTTKGDDGTGLGLSMVYGFVKQSGGHVKIYSEAGHGTTIKLYLPRTLEADAAAYRTPAGGDLSGSETILVVEDDNSVRETVIDMLTDLGYRVLQAANGALGLTILESGEKIDLLFTDVIMPGSVSSRVMSDRAVELRPGIKILFTSGYTENTIVHNGRLYPGVQLISKPYGREQLAKKVRAVLAQERPTPDEAVQEAG